MFESLLNQIDHFFLLTFLLLSPLDYEPTLWTFLPVTMITICSFISEWTSWILKSSFLPPSRLIGDLTFVYSICFSFVLCLRYSSNQMN